jgi:FAD synthase
VKPDPFAVIVKPCPPTVAVLGLTKERTEEEVCRERFVLYWEQAEASAHATNATMSHLRENIRTRSSRAILAQRQADKSRARALLEARQRIS